MELIENLKNDFTEIFNENPTNIYFSPGRVNLIGEHTDYNGGNVFPCALSIGTYGLTTKRDDKKVRLYSNNFKDIGVIEFDLDQLKFEKEHDWANYPKGVIKTFKDHGFDISNGFNVLIYGNIPNGSGLSSSASLELLTSIILKDTFNLEVDMVSMVKMSQEAENKFIGVNCGIMDQFAIGMGTKDCAILLDCNTLEYRYSKINMDGYKLVIGNTNKKRGLVDSKYNERRAECEEALRILKEYKNVSSLGELTEEDFESLKDKIENPIIRKRAKHAVLENIRTLKAVETLENNNIKTFGELMNQSHISLRDDYEVTGIELDTLVEAAWDQKDNVIGSRMTGAGFGGCTISIVKEDAIDEFISYSTEKYEKIIGYKPSFYVVDISDGTRKLF
ncbi:galactokinase [Clostridium sp.]|uniref:galactokinase n=1 Tax=Clostridium sp. TaxID=1506 RepID=UPI0026F0A4F9|nr:MULTISPECIES: galactokinase [Clostridium]MBS7129578.1 galactokinase [Clostridium sp.]MDU2283075.1 galactokinase [Clostridium sp.]